MKTSTLLALTICIGLALTSGARAATVNVSGSDYFLGNDINNQSGTISTSPTSVGAGTAYDLSYGVLAPDSEITFTYTSLPSGFLTATGSYGNLATQYYISSVNGNTTATGSSFFGSSSVNPSILPVLVTSNISGTTGTAEILNKTNTSVSFSSYFLSSISTLTGIGASYNVSAVPLPATAILFIMGLVALLGFANYKKGRHQS